MANVATLEHLSLGDALAFLLVHDPEDAKRLGYHLPLKSQHPDKAAEETVHDVKAYLTVRTTKKYPLEQSITVVAPDIGRTFTHTGPYPWPPYNPFPLQDTSDRVGTLYLRGTIPDLGDSGFVAQQFPRYPLLAPQLPDFGGVDPPRLGRVVIDFWTSARITAVFKTDEENYVSGGNGVWTPVV
ncbi:hypothetical protein F5I97DRAFT_1928968 [Phlebopus sp. FC_14]|nr:hypothetical protein F5I97DRAFT_1928968 [Phlebopus sp. FC_14]